MPLVVTKTGKNHLRDVYDLVHSRLLRLLLAAVMQR